MGIEKVSDFNFLGVILDECLTWKPHIDKLASKLSLNGGISNKLKNFLSAFIMKTLYFSHSHSHLNYGILIWEYRCSRLIKLQKRLFRIVTLQWHHNGRYSVSNHQPHSCLLNRLFKRRSKKTSKLRVTDLCVGNSPGTGEFPAQMASNAENVSIWWRHHECLRNTMRIVILYSSKLQYKRLQTCSVSRL